MQTVCQFYYAGCEPRECWVLAVFWGTVVGGLGACWAVFVHRVDAGALLWRIFVFWVFVAEAAPTGGLSKGASMPSP